MGLLAAIFVASAFIFRAAIKAQKTAKAVLEITQKLQTITSQIDTDFKGLRKDGLIYMFWVPSPKIDNSGAPLTDVNGTYDGYDCFDRVVFFANGYFQTYNEYDHDSDAATSPIVLTGNTARITYMLASDADLDIVSPVLTPARWQQPADRILARSQHILIKDPLLGPFPDFGNIPVLDWSVGGDNLQYLKDHNFNYEYDNAAIDDWNNASQVELQEMFTLATNFQFGINDPTRGGLVVTADDPDSLHMMLCQRVGSFSVQRRIWDTSGVTPIIRWWPQIDPDGDGILEDERDYFVDPSDPTNLDLSTVWYLPYPGNEISFDIFFGGALKFTFTIYDSKGVFPEGKVFSHIVYLD